MEELIQDAFDNGHTHFLEMSGGEVNQTELIAAMINQKDTYVDGIINVLRKVKGSISFMLMTKDGLYLVRDKLGRTPLNIGKGENGFCASFESHAYINLGYSLYKELGPGEVCFMTSEEVKTLVEANDKMKICSFLWVYYGYPTSCYEGRNVEEMRYECGRLMAQRDDIKDIEQVFLIVELPMRLVIQMNHIFNMEDLLLNTHLRGHVHLCHKFKRIVI